MDWGIDSVCDRNIQIRAWVSRTVDKTKSSKILPTDAAPQFLKKLTPFFQSILAQYVPALQRCFVRRPG